MTIIAERKGVGGRPREALRVVLGRLGWALAAWGVTFIVFVCIGPDMLLRNVVGYVWAEVVVRFHSYIPAYGGVTHEHAYDVAKYWTLMLHQASAWGLFVAIATAAATLVFGTLCTRSWRRSRRGMIAEAGHSVGAWQGFRTALERSKVGLSVLLSRLQLARQNFASKRQRIDDLAVRVRLIESQNDAVFDLLEIMAGELGHVAGVARMSTKTSEPALRAATAHEATLKAAVASARRRLEGGHEGPVNAESAALSNGLAHAPRA